MWQPSKIPRTWNRTAGATLPVFPSTKQKLQKQSLKTEIYPEGHCEHRHKPQGMLDAKQVPEILNPDLLVNLVSHLGIIVGPIQLLHDSVFLSAQRLTGGFSSLSNLTFAFCIVYIQCSGCQK